MSDKALQPAKYINETTYEYKFFYDHSDGFNAFGLHFHDCYEILIHLQGGQHYCISHQIIKMEPYDIYVIPPNHIHGMLGDVTLDGYERMYLHITSATLELLGYGVLNVKATLDEIAQNPRQRIHLDPQDWAMFKPMLPHIKNAYSELAPHDRITSMGCLSILISCICNAARRTHPCMPVESVSPLLQQACSYIADHFTGECTLEGIAQHFNVSKHHLARCFSQTFRVSVYQYVLMCRIAYAKTLILQGEALNVVGYRCGFRDYSNFLRAFTKQQGVSPSKWKESMMNTGGT